MNNLIIGLAGGTGSGKTTVAKKLYQAFQSDAIILSHDYYYKANEGMTFEQRCQQNYDHPDALDTDLLVEHIRQLKQGNAINHPTYDFSKHQRNEQWVTVKAKSIIIVEGILIFSNQQLCDLCDIKLFVDTDDDVRFIRRLRRDVNKRGRSMESVISQYLTTVKPMHEQFVEPTKRKADLIIPEGGHNLVAMSAIIDTINRFKAEQQSKMSKKPPQTRKKAKNSKKPPQTAKKAENSNKPPQTAKKAENSNKNKKPL